MVYGENGRMEEKMEQAETKKVEKNSKKCGKRERKNKAREQETYSPWNVWGWVCYEILACFPFRERPSLQFVYTSCGQQSFCQDHSGLSKLLKMSIQVPRRTTIHVLWNFQAKNTQSPEISFNSKENKHADTAPETVRHDKR